MAADEQAGKFVPIPFHAKVEWPDFLALVKSPLRTWFDKLFRICFRSLPLVFLAGALTSSEQVDLVFCIVCFVASFGGIWFIIPRLHRWQAKKSFTPLELKGQLNDDGIVVTTENAYASMPWQSLFGYRMLGDVLLIHSTQDACHMLPVSAFQSEDDRDRAIKLVRSKLVKATAGTKVSVGGPPVPENRRYRSIPEDFAMIRDQDGAAYQGCIDLADYARAETLSLAQTVKDFEKSIRRLGRLRYWMRIASNVVVWCFVGFVFVPPFLFESAFGVGSAIALFVILFFALTGPWLSATRMRSMMRARRRWREQRGSIGEYGILSDDGREVSILAWSACSGFRAGKDMLIVYNSDVSYLTFPRSFFDHDHDWQLALHYVTSNVPDLMPNGSVIHVAGVLACRQCGMPEGGAAMLHFGNDLVCADCKDSYIQRLREGVVGDAG